MLRCSAIDASNAVLIKGQSACLRDLAGARNLFLVLGSGPVTSSGGTRATHSECSDGRRWSVGPPLRPTTSRPLAGAHAVTTWSNFRRDAKAIGRIEPPALLLGWSDRMSGCR